MKLMKLDIWYFTGKLYGSILFFSTNSGCFGFTDACVLMLIYFEIILCFLFVLKKNIGYI